ncbi:hypothetical protein EJB05_01973 [Eragrostis curvula]|uniref:PB1 domain-containing protein n=1 Tax=Eragrostis curvula TaxID=38414 RepID=A0A5J9WRL9_9POAL|nr:hypothetical protein EJB05_01973 [Eragrostis curvula]
MPGTPSASSSSSSCVSFSSFDEVPAAKPPGPPASTNGTVKFVCSYGGKILPRRHDGKLRYVGGHTRVLSVQRSLRFHDLHRKLRELCGWDAVTVRCQLPTEDMDALVSVTSDGDLAGVLDEYDVAAARQDRPSQQQQQLRIRVFLHPPAGAGARTTPHAPFTPHRASRRRPGHLLMQARRVWPPRAVRYVVASPLVPGSPARAESCPCWQ